MNIFNIVTSDILVTLNAFKLHIIHNICSFFDGLFISLVASCRTRGKDPAENRNGVKYRFTLTGLSDTTLNERTLALVQSKRVILIRMDGHGCASKQRVVIVYPVLFSILCRCKSNVLLQSRNLSLRAIVVKRIWIMGTQR